MITVAKLIANKIESWGVKHVPIFQGGAIMNVLSEIGKNKKITYYCPYHEQALAMAVAIRSRMIHAPSEATSDLARTVTAYALDATTNAKISRAMHGNA